MSGVLSFAGAKDYEAPDDADSDGTYRLTVEVSDGGRSATSGLTVTLVNVNEAPTADAGSDQADVAEGSTVTLSGRGTDPDSGDTLSYAWAQTGGDTVSLSATSTATATFMAPTGLSADTSLTFTLRVMDDEGLYHEDHVSISVAPEPALTARFEQVPSSHDGSSPFTFHLYFSEEIPLRYKTLWYHAFTVTGGEVVKTHRLAPPSNIGWEITVRPSWDDNMIITLPGNRACDVTGPICTSDGERLSASISATVGGAGTRRSGAGGDHCSGNNSCRGGRSVILNRQPGQGGACRPVCGRQCL